MSLYEFGLVWLEKVGTVLRAQTTDDDHLVYFKVFTSDNRKSVLAVPESQTADHKVRGSNRSVTSRRFCT